MRFEVTVLGTGSASPTTSRHHSAHVLNIHEQYYLVDCGEGTQLRLMECGVSFLKINAVFISHLHGDHLFGIMPLISSMGNLGRKRALTVYAPRPFDEILDFHLKHFDQNIPFDIIFKEVNTRENSLIFENNNLEVWTIPLRHRIPASGYLFREKQPKRNIRKEAIGKYDLGIAQIAAAKRGEDLYDTDGSLIVQNSEITYIPYPPRSYAYCSDTQYSAKVAGIVAGVDLLYHEATFAESDKALAKETGHSTASQAAKVALKARAERLLLGHISSRYKDEKVLLDEAKAIFPNTEIATEKNTYEIARKNFDL